MADRGVGGGEPSALHPDSLQQGRYSAGDDTGQGCVISKIKHEDFRPSDSVTLRVRPLDSETGWTGEIKLNRVLLI